MDYNYFIYVVKIIFYLLLVVGIIYLAARIYKNNFLQQKNGRHISTIESFYLGAKKQISLVKVNDRIYLLGMTDENIELLDKWQENDFDSLDLVKQDSEEHNSFSDYMDKFLQRKRRDYDE